MSRWVLLGPGTGRTLFTDGQTDGGGRRLRRPKGEHREAGVRDTLVLRHGLLVTDAVRALLAVAVEPVLEPQTV